MPRRWKLFFIVARRGVPSQIKPTDFGCKFCSLANVASFSSSLLCISAFHRKRRSEGPCGFKLVAGWVMVGWVMTGGVIWVSTCGVDTRAGSLAGVELLAASSCADVAAGSIRSEDLTKNHTAIPAIKSMMIAAPTGDSFLELSPLLVRVVFVAAWGECETGLSKFSGLAKRSTQGLRFGVDGATAGGSSACISWFLSILRFPESAE